MHCLKPVDIVVNAYLNKRKSQNSGKLGRPFTLYRLIWLQNGGPQLQSELSNMYVLVLLIASGMNMPETHRNHGNLRGCIDSAFVTSQTANCPTADAVNGAHLLPRSPGKNEAPTNLLFPPRHSERRHLLLPGHLFSSSIDTLPASLRSQHVNRQFLP